MKAQAVLKTPESHMEPQSLSIAADRKRLSPAAVTGFKSMMSKWDLNHVQSAALLGVATATWTRMKGADWAGELTQDQLTRVSALLGIFKALNILFVGEMASRWPLLRNKGPLFEGVSPVEMMIEEGIPGMLQVRQYLDALRGGL